MPATSNSELAGSWESIATQTLVISVIRARLVPFFKSRPSWTMLVVPTRAALVGAVLPYTGLAHLLGFTPLPTTFLPLLFGMVVVYLLFVELAKTRIYRSHHAQSPRISASRSERVERRIRRRMSRSVHFVAPRGDPT